MRYVPLVSHILGATLAASVAACGDKALTGPSTPDAAAALAITGSDVLAQLGQMAQLTATATLADGLTRDVTAVATWQSSVPGRVSVSATGLVQAVDYAGSDITATYGGTVATLRVIVAAREDCLPYDPTALILVEGTRSGLPIWILMEPLPGGGAILHVNYDNPDDAEDGLALAQRHTSDCFTGRNYFGADRRDRLVHYYEGTSGLQTALSREDCDPYDPTRMQVRFTSDAAWAVFSGAQIVALVDSESGGGRAMLIARNHQARCYIGRGRPRADPGEFVLSYFK